MGSDEKNGEAKKGKVKRVSFDGYKTVGNSLKEMIAHALWWKRNKSPGAVIPYIDLAKAVYGPRRLAASEIETVKAACGRARWVMLAKYKCSTITVGGVGIRATTGDEDAAIHELPGRQRRAESAVSSLAASVAVVDPSKIKNAALKAYVVDVKGKSTVLEGHLARMRALLPVPEKKDKK
jgi:hypothetical protein